VGWEALAPLAKWGAITAILVGLFAIAMKAGRDAGEFRALLKAAEVEDGKRTKADRARAGSAASGDSAARKFKRLRKALGW
jgi:hypothetical protein